MTVAWIVKGNKALSGEVIETNTNYYTVKVTSYSHRTQARLVGKLIAVKRTQAQVIQG